MVGCPTYVQSPDRRDTQWRTQEKNSQIEKAWNSLFQSKRLNISGVANSCFKWKLVNTQLIQKQQWIHVFIIYFLKNDCRQVLTEPTLPVLLAFKYYLRFKYWNQTKFNWMVKLFQTWPNVVRFSDETAKRQRLIFSLQMALLSIIWPSSWLHIPPKPPQWGRISLETVCQIPVWGCGRRRGEAPKDLLGSSRSCETKGTLWHWLTHPRKHDFLSRQIQHPPHNEQLTSQNWKLKVPF